MEAVSVLLRGLWLTASEFAKTPSTKRESASSEQRRTASAHSKQSTWYSKLTWDEIARHNEQDDCWIVIKNKVYDVSEFGNVHPGGSVIFTQGGRDATDVFTSFHATSTWSFLKQFHIGDVVDQTSCPVDSSESLLQDFRNLRQSLLKQGLFRADPFYYFWKTSFNLSILVSVLALLNAHDSWKHLLPAAFLLGLFFQQMGWLAHDFCHHQVFKNRIWNNFFAYIFGNVLQGFSCDWWKSKHNTHHAATNEIDAKHCAIDPDIDTLPLLAWSPEMLATLETSERALVRYQHILFFPILFFARFSWAQQSYSHAFAKFLSQKDLIEFPLILIHYIWHFGIAFAFLSPLKAILFLLICQAVSGFMLGLAFVQSHNGMEIYGDAKDFVTAQVISTRDIRHSTFVDFFMGGLNYQIEHHLFPTMPRHNLRKAQIAVKVLCEKYELPYEECSMTVGTQRVLQRLVDVSKLA